MKKQKLRGKHLKHIGFEGEYVSIALNIIEKNYKHDGFEKQLEILRSVKENPEKFENDENWNALVSKILVEKNIQNQKEIELHTEIRDYKIFGKEHIEAGAIQQMETAMKLPVSIAGALMPDAHQGYGLPIGGVLAVDNAVIPFGVGMDIGCRMCLSIFKLPENHLERYKTNLKQILIENTFFGNKGMFKEKKDFEHEIFERSEFKEIKFLKNLQNKAYKQLGTSGSGNHFVEFGDVEILDENNEFNLPTGKYIGLLSHSGSRGMGAEIAQHYTRLAQEICLLPKSARHLAWFKLNEEAGQEYWKAMNLAGDFASANHHTIHNQIAKAMKEKPVAVVENHHNFAWKETLHDGTSAIIHRKGATPAAKGDLGLIPGSMASEAFIVRGKGNAESLNSASHGAGRLMSRAKASSSFAAKEIKQYLKKMNVELIGGGKDEAPFAYKDIHKVMKAQEDLVDVIGTFFPRIVRMDT